MNFPFFKKRYKSLRRGLLHLLLSGIIFVVFRVGVMGSPPVFAPSDNPASDHPSVITRTLTFLYLPVFNLWLLIYPRWLSFDWSMEAIPLIHTLSDSRNIASLIFYGCLVILLKRIYQKSFQEYSSFDSCGCAPCNYQHHHHQQPHLKHLKRPFNLKTNNNNSMCSTIDDDLCTVGNGNNNNNAMQFSSSISNISFSNNNSSICFTTEDYNSNLQSFTKTDSVIMSLTLMTIPFLPATNLFFYVGFVIAERILYIPSIGYCLFITIGIETVMKRKTIRFITLIALSILLMSFSARTFVRNIDWLTEENLYRSGIPINPPKGNVHQLN